MQTALKMILSQATKQQLKVMSFSSKRTVIRIVALIPFSAIFIVKFAKANLKANKESQHPMVWQLSLHY